MAVKRKRKIKKGIRKWENTIIMNIVVIYMCFTGLAFWDVGQSHIGVTDEKPTTRIASVWLDSVPYHQPFMANRTVGIRVYLSNPDNVSEGVVSIRIGEQKTGEVLYTYDVLATEITDSVYKDYIEIIPEDLIFDDDVVYYIEIDALSCADKTIKTYLAASGTYGVSHVGDQADLTDKMLCFTVVKRITPLLFIVWIFMTSLVVMLLVFIFAPRRHNKEYEDIKFPTSFESKLIIPVLLLIGLFGTGILSADKLTTRTVNINDEALVGGYELVEHSSYNQQFKVKRKDLKEIHVSLENFFENVGTFVISIQKGQDEVIKSVQNVELDKIDGAYYIWDVSDLDLEKGETYDLYIYTGFIGKNEENPIIKRIEYIYSK